MGGSCKSTAPLPQALLGTARLPPCQERAPGRHSGRHFLSDHSVAFQLRKLSDRRNSELRNECFGEICVSW